MDRRLSPLALRLYRGIRRKLFGVGYFGERILITSEVEVWNGKTHFLCRHNHFVNQGLVHIINVFTSYRVTGTFGTSAGKYTMKLGTDTTTVTTPGMTALVAEVATEPNTLSGLNSNPTVGTVRMAVAATWNAGTVAGTVGELGLRWGLHNAIQAWRWDCGGSANKLLMSRLSAADGDFLSFVINAGAPLTIEWRVTFTFA